MFADQGILIIYYTPLLGVEQAWTPILYLTDLLCKSLALQENLSTYFGNVFHSPAPRTHQSFFRQISENVTVSLFAKHVLPYEFWAFEWKNSPFSPLFSSNRHFGQWLRSLTMSVMDVRKNSRYLDNLRSELGANSAAAMVREAPLRKYSSSFGHCPFGGGGGF